MLLQSFPRETVNKSFQEISQTRRENNWKLSCREQCGPNIRHEKESFADFLSIYILLGSHEAEQRCGNNGLRTRSAGVR